MKPEIDQKELILKWQKTKRKEDMSQILDSLSPLINSEVDRWTRGGTIPRSAVELRAKALVSEALDKYDPRKSAVSTFVVNQIKPISRTVYSSQNLARIPESRIAIIGSFKAAQNELYNQLGREPNSGEVADKMGVPLKTVNLLNREMWREAASTSLQDSMYSGFGNYHAMEALENLWFSSGEHERLVLEHLTGLHGKKKMSSMSAIARATGLTPYQVRSAREYLKKRVQEHLGTLQANI